MNYDRYAILWEFCQALAWADDPKTVYQRIVDTAVRAFDCESVSLHLIDVDSNYFIRRAAYSDNVSEIVGSGAVTLDVGRMRILYETQDLIIMDYDNPNGQDEIPEEAIDAGFKCAISIPLYIESGSIGMLSLSFKRALPFDDEDLAFLKSLGAALGSLVNRVLMTKKDVELQMLMERKRLSNEIHDNIAQLVSAIGIKVDTAIECREDDDLEALDEELDNLAEMTRKVTKMLRAEMLTLRTTLDEGGDIADGIRDLLLDFQDRWGIQVEYSNECRGRVVAAEYVQLQLVRIVNESLQNVLRHSKADRIEAVLSSSGKVFKVSIRDNGVGFNIQAVAPERLGLRIMRERARSAGGELVLKSDSAGTEVVVEVPALIV